MEKLKVVELAEKEFPIFETTNDVDREFLMNCRRCFEKGFNAGKKEIIKNIKPKFRTTNY